MAFITIIPETFAQTPNAAPVKVLVVFPSSPAPASKPRLVSSPAITHLNGPSLSEATAIEKRAFELINEARQSKGLFPLSWDPELCLMARAHSQDMVRRRFFSHETPDGRDTTDRAHALGIAHFQILGENIAYNQGFEDPGAFAVERWLLSSSHRANILNPQFQASAIGVSVSADGTVFLTQEFITR
jgi:uncharacterized protein YkwD